MNLRIPPVTAPPMAALARAPEPPGTASVIETTGAM